MEEVGEREEMWPKGGQPNIAPKAYFAPDLEENIDYAQEEEIPEDF